MYNNIISDEKRGNQFRSALNAFFQSNFKNAGDLESLKYAIEIEDLIIRSGFYIEYEFPKGAIEIRRAARVYKNTRNINQKFTIAKMYGDQLPKEKIKETFVEDSAEIIPEDIQKEKNFKDMFVFNKNTNDVGYIRTYNRGNIRNAKGNPIKNVKMRFAVKHLIIKNGVLVINDNTWNENSCLVFKDSFGLMDYLENEKFNLFKTKSNNKIQSDNTIEEIIYDLKNRVIILEKHQNENRGNK